MNQKAPDWDCLPPLRDVIARYDLRAEKKLGQNFLLDMNITDKIVRSCGDLTGVTVFEIGPGPGGLTRSLLKAGAQKVIAIEFDERAVKALCELEDFSAGRLHVIHGDAMETDLLSLAPDARRAVVANLPYNIATPLLIGWLRQIRQDQGAYEQLVLMFQHEVTQRITAPVNTKHYGRLAVISQWLCDVEHVLRLPPQAFTPPPKVTSGVVRFTPRMIDKDAPDFESVERITAAAFGQRRKMIRSSLKDYEDFLNSCGLDPAQRAETVDVGRYIDLARQVSLKASL